MKRLPTYTFDLELLKNVIPKSPLAMTLKASYYTKVKNFKPTQKA